MASWGSRGQLREISGADKGREISPEVGGVGYSLSYSQHAEESVVLLDEGDDIARIPVGGSVEENLKSRKERQIVHIGDTTSQNNAR